MKAIDLRYIKVCAEEYQNSSVQKLSTQMVRALLEERDYLLDALQALNEWQGQMGGFEAPAWFEAREAIDRATDNDSYDGRVRNLEEQGLTTSDAQAAVDAEDQSRKEDE